MGVVPDSVRSARYWRYCQNKPETFCNIAEIEFIDSIGNVMQGTIIGTDGYFGSNSNMTKEAVFDNDPLTVFDQPFHRIFEGGICQSPGNSIWGIFGLLLNFFKKLRNFSVFNWNFN